MSESIERKLTELKKIFPPNTTAEQRYTTIIDLGRKLPPFPDAWKTSDRIVRGCQSTLYLHTTFEDGKLFFSTFSDALISAGLSALLTHFYSGESPETILKTPPLFLQELNILSSLSPNRSNGLSQIYLRIKQDTLKFLIVK